MDAGGYWSAARKFRAPPDAEAKHQARVELLKLALSDMTAIGQRAADMLRQEGIIVVRNVNVVGARAL